MEVVQIHVLRDYWSHWKHVEQDAERFQNSLTFSFPLIFFHISTDRSHDNQNRREKTSRDIPAVRILRQHSHGFQPTTWPAHLPVHAVLAGYCVENSANDESQRSEQEDETSRGGPHSSDVLRCVQMTAVKVHLPKCTRIRCVTWQRRGPVELLDLFRTYAWRHQWFSRFQTEH